MIDDQERKEQEAALQEMMNRLQREDPVWAREKKLMMIVGMLVVALVATVGIAMLLKAPKEEELARHRCETEQSVAMTWKQTQSLKAANPGMTSREMQSEIEAKRSEFKEAAKAACATK